MFQKSFFTILVTVLFFVGCAHYDVKKPSAQRNLRQITPNNGYVVFSDFDIPQPVNRPFQVSTATWKANPVFVDIYDVTQNLNYIGHFAVNPPIYNYSNSFIEQSLSLGKHTFMLVFKSKFWGMTVDNLTDFIEVDITKENITHIAVSYYPYKKTLLGSWMLQPKFTQILMKDKDFEFCSQTISNKEAREQNISNYMQLASIDSKQKYFQSYCQLLSSDQTLIYALNEKSYEDFETEKSKIEEIKNRDYQEWQNSKNKNRVFPLIQPQWVTQQK